MKVVVRFEDQTFRTYIIRPDGEDYWLGEVPAGSDPAALRDQLNEEAAQLEAFLNG